MALQLHSHTTMSFGDLGTALTGTAINASNGLNGYVRLSTNDMEKLLPVANMRGSYAAGEACDQLRSLISIHAISIANTRAEMEAEEERLLDLLPHGGITYCDFATGWIGFDTVHWGDLWLERDQIDQDNLQPADSKHLCELPSQCYHRRWTETDVRFEAAKFAELLLTVLA